MTGSQLRSDALGLEGGSRDSFFGAKELPKLIVKWNSVVRVSVCSNGMGSSAASLPSSGNMASPWPGCDRAGTALFFSRL